MSTPPANLHTSLRQKIHRFLHPEEALNLVVPPGENPNLWLARERIVTNMIRTTALIGLPLLAISLPLFIAFGQLAVGMIYVFTVVAMWVLSLWPNLSHKLKTTVFVSFFYLLGLSETLNYGYSVEGYIFFLVFIIASNIFSGKKMGLFAFFLSLTTMVILGTLIVEGIFAPLSLEPEKINYTFESWLVSWLVFLLMAIMVGGSSAQIIGSLDASWRHEMQAMQQLQDERDRLEQRVQERTRDLASARDQALSANHYKSELMARVSHELRTPLGAILGYSEMLHSGKLGPLEDRQKRALKDMLDSTNHLTDLINDLLDQSYIDSGSIEITHKPFEVQKLVDHALGFKAKAEGKGLRYSVQLDPSLPGLLVGDEKRVRQVLNNLISNAIKFTENGEVRVNLSPVNGSHWMIEVRDTGSGIPPEVQARVFEPFWQLDSALTRTKEGHGLGLAIVKQITDLLGGQVALQSASGQGSTFRVTLPLRRMP